MTENARSVHNFEGDDPLPLEINDDVDIDGLVKVVVPNGHGGAFTFYRRLPAEVFARKLIGDFAFSDIRVGLADRYQGLGRVPTMNLGALVGGPGHEAVWTDSEDEANTIAESYLAGLITAQPHAARQPPAESKSEIHPAFAALLQEFDDLEPNLTGTGGL